MWLPVNNSDLQVKTYKSELFFSPIKKCLFFFSFFVEKDTYDNWDDMILKGSPGVQVVLEDLDDHHNQFLVALLVQMVQVAQL